jgi:hypothetical protein
MSTVVASEEPRRWRNEAVGEFLDEPGWPGTEIDNRFLLRLGVTARLDAELWLLRRGSKDPSERVVASVNAESTADWRWSLNGEKDGFLTRHVSAASTALPLVALLHPAVDVRVG